MILGPNKWAKQFEKKKKKKSLVIHCFFKCFPQCFLCGMAPLLKPPKLKAPRLSWLFHLFPYYHIWICQGLSFLLHSASLLSVLAATPRLGHQRSILPVLLLSSCTIWHNAAEQYYCSAQIPPLLQLKNLKSSPPLRKYSPHCSARYSRSPATWYQLTSAPTYLSKFIFHHTCGPFGDGDCILVDETTLPDSSP